MIVYSFLIVLCALAIVSLLLYMERGLHADTRRQLWQVMDLEQRERQRRQRAEADVARAQFGGHAPRPSLPPSYLPPRFFFFLDDSSLTPPAPQPRTYSIEELEGGL